jgi:hypothetical protein
MSDMIVKPDGSTFDDDATITFPPTFVHHDAGKYKDQPEAFFLDKAVRVLLDLPDQTRVPAWLDVTCFRDDTTTGKRWGWGKLRSTVLGYTNGVEYPFAPGEVFDTIQRFIPQPGYVFLGNLGT